MTKVQVWGENGEESVKSLLRSLLSARLEGITHNVPLLRGVMADKEAAGAMPGFIEDRNGHVTSPNGSGAMSSNERDNNGDREDRETAAVIAVALAMALKANSPASAPAHTPNVWRSYGRRAQLLSRAMGGSRGWR